MRYQLAALPFEQDLLQYRAEGRGVDVQWLDLSDAQANELAAALAENAKPENAHYAYQYFDDNCSTRVRDSLDRVLDGGLRRQIEGRSHGSTYRSEAVRLASPAWWMWLGFDVGLGPSSDKPLPVWNDMSSAARSADIRTSMSPLPLLTSTGPCTVTTSTSPLPVETCTLALAFRTSTSPLPVDTRTSPSVSAIRTRPFPVEACTSLPAPSTLTAPFPVESFTRTPRGTSTVIATVTWRRHPSWLFRSP
jgi:hypothetical protein